MTSKTLDPSHPKALAPAPLAPAGGDAVSGFLSHRPLPPIGVFAKPGREKPDAWYPEVAEVTEEQDDARPQLEKALLNQVLADFQEHGALTVARMRTQNPAQFLRLLVTLLPRHSTSEISIKHTHAMSDEELLRLANSGRSKTVDAEYEIKPDRG